MTLVWVSSLRVENSNLTAAPIMDQFLMPDANVFRNGISLSYDTDNRI